jgi:hypothetical protein
MPVRRQKSSDPFLDQEDAMRLTARRSTFVLAALLGLAAAAPRQTGAGQPVDKRTRAEFMRQKLGFAKDALEGLALERFATIEKSGKALKRLSEAAEWEVGTIPDFTDYVAMTTEFQRYADDLVKQAKQKNIDGATLAYLKLTTSCVQCHKFVRRISK